MEQPTEDEIAILRAAHRLYPVTVERLKKELKTRPAAFELALRNLVRKGLVVLEPLDDRTYVRPMALLDAPPPPRPRDDHDPAFM